MHEHREIVLLAHEQLAFLEAALSPRYQVVRAWEPWSPGIDLKVMAIVAAGEAILANHVLDRLPNVGLIACFTAGYDGVDVEEARRRDIAVSHAEGANHEDVADHALGMIIAHRRGIVAGDRAVRQGDWTAKKTVTRSLVGIRLGIVGLGRIGNALAHRAEAMRMSVRWWGPRADPYSPRPRADGILDLARNSDILVLAARAHSSNHRMIDAEVLDALGPEGLFVNVARGQLVDEDALVAALRDGRLGGAALDVFATEPTPQARWVDVPNVLLTPHGGGATDRAVRIMTDQLLANLKAHFAGEPLPTPVPAAQCCP